MPTSTVIEEFDAMRITNASVQFKKKGTQQPGQKFGAIGTISGDTESKTITKVEEGVETKKKVIPQKMNLSISAHIPVAVAREYFGLSNEGLKPGIYSYGSDSLGTDFVLTADVIDDFEDVKKLIAFPNASNSGGYTLNIENGQEEVALLEMSVTALVDDNKKFYYEAFVDELEDATIAEKWHTNFTPELVAVPDTP
ncbi:hypothetical protein [Lysinibacillus odysseyi]|uniref:Tail protein n=1 Tax=Lysinibacillus odysseyi 34hs-1 = NBRC 100172 TaxID=1220589 RepID=A0A0A3IY79_9BACI|nr:hypothetical protein [Lysinibacillus odysseyi]KGR88400.1 tail protein [Lysinibacillus odysseyi 34hs-1 = NBRC 100172]